MANYKDGSENVRIKWREIVCSRITELQGMISRRELNSNQENFAIKTLDWNKEILKRLGV